MWFELNKETNIKVKTGVGVSGTARVGETVAQGSIGGALASSLNLDVEVNNFFSGSIDEVSYSNVRLQPIILQDDLCRLCTSADSARNGVRRMENIMKLKQLDINVDKSSYIVCKKSSKNAEIRQDFKIIPLKYDGLMMKEKECEKYLGDMINGGGLSESIESTITERHGRIFGSILEIRTILEDYRSSRAGGVTSGIMLWEVAVIPSLINNSETWTELEETQLERMEDLQSMLLRTLFNTAKTTPRALLYWDTGVLPISYKIEQQKLLFLHHLVILSEDSLAKQIYIQQKNNDFPGLVPECKELIKKYNLADIISEENIPSKLSWKNTVKRAIRDHCASELKTEIKEKYKKLENIETEKENFEAKPYLTELNLIQARTKFKLRSRMLELRNNYKGEYRKTNLLCEGCKVSIETQDHVLFCPFYSDLRQDIDLSCDKDLVNYYREVMNIREKLKDRK